MDSEPAEKTEKSIADLVAEYKSAFLHGDRFLEGFGTFLAIDAIGSARKEQRRDALLSEKPSYNSEPFLDTDLGSNYFDSLAKTEWEIFGAGKKHETISYARLTQFIEEFIDTDIGKIKRSPSAYLCEYTVFLHAWFDDMLRAGIKGTRRAGCEITDLPLQYSEKKQGKISSVGLEQKVDSLDKKLDTKLDSYTGLLSRFKKYSLAGLVGLYVLAATAGIASFVFVQNAKKQLKEKEAEWEKKIDYRINSAYDNAIINVESLFRQKIDSYMNSCAPDIGKGLSLEERLPLVFAQLKEDTKNELVKTTINELIPIFEARYGQPISDEDIERIADKLISMIKSGRITISDLLQAPDKKNE